jgi:hypothetical protein
MLVTEGVGLLNPLFFPNTLPSAVPCTIAAECRAKAFAFAVGYSPHSFFEALMTAVQLIKTRHAGSVLIAAVFDAGPVNRRAVAGVNPSLSLGDVSICCLVSTSKPRCGQSGMVRKIAVGAKRVADSVQGCLLEEPSSVRLFSARWDDDLTVKAFYPSRLNHVWMGCATGAVMCMEALGVMTGHSDWSSLVTVVLECSKTKSLLALSDLDG